MHRHFIDKPQEYINIILESEVQILGFWGSFQKFQKIEAAVEIFEKRLGKFVEFCPSQVVEFYFIVLTAG